MNILATWRLMEMLRDEDAPYDSFKRFREYVRLNRASYYGQAPNTTRLERFIEEIGQVLDCDWCLSFWCGLFVCAANRQNPINAFAYSAGALFVSYLHNQRWLIWLKSLSKG